MSLNGVVVALCVIKIDHNRNQSHKITDTVEIDWYFVNLKTEAKM